MKVNTLKLNHAGYPDILTPLPNPPHMLSWIGKDLNSLLDRPRIAVVGSRKATPYGRQVTENFVAKLSRAGIVIVSGLALGIDSIAHKAALESGGQTIAVLPSGLDKIYPAGHYNLAQRIVDNGVLISEYPLGSEVYRNNFIERNRIISGLADGLLITEAAASSGTMHTARFALDQGKTVMAVPGNINSPSSEGCNNLIKSGALPVTSVDDIFFAMNIKADTRVSRRVVNGSREEQQLLDFIGGGINSQDELATACKLTPAKMASSLTALEINGYIRPAGAGNWVVA